MTLKEATIQAFSELGMIKTQLIKEIALKHADATNPKGAIQAERLIAPGREREAIELLKAGKGAEAWDLTVANLQNQ